MHLEETFIKTNEPKRICNVLFGASDTPDIAFVLEILAIIKNK